MTFSLNLVQIGFLTKVFVGRNQRLHSREKTTKKKKKKKKKEGKKTRRQSIAISMDPPLVLAIQTSRQGINLLLFCCCCSREGGGDDTDQDEQSWVFDDCSLWEESWLISNPEDQTIYSEEEKRENVSLEPHWDSFNQERPLTFEHVSSPRLLTNRRNCRRVSLDVLLSYFLSKSDRERVDICIPAEEEFLYCPWKH
jgi:hypothetical protein